MDVSFAFADLFLPSLYDHRGGVKLRREPARQPLRRKAWRKVRAPKSRMRGNAPAWRHDEEGHRDESCWVWKQVRQG